jgi:hypothetical protein
VISLPKLNFPSIFEPRLKKEGKDLKIYDVVRKKFFVLTPEEWVRQHTVFYLHHDKHFPLSLMMLEKEFKYGTLKKRMDVLIYDKEGQPFFLVECKAPNIKISQETFHQIARYNMVFKVKYLLITNGLNHFCCEMNYENQSYVFLHEVPDFLS